MNIHSAHSFIKSISGLPAAWFIELIIRSILMKFLAISYRIEFKPRFNACVDTKGFYPSFNYKFASFPSLDPKLVMFI